MERGASRDGTRNEDLERLTFPDESFDLFITQDVFEHIFGASTAFREIARVLRPGGAHVFTVPYWPDRSTRVRAIRAGSEIEHLRKPIYHDDPIDPTGALVIRDWGNDLTGFIKDACGLDTQIIEPNERRKGLLDDFLEVFVTKK
jgi:SAM-dependent methyltransferase